MFTRSYRVHWQLALLLAAHVRPTMFVMAASTDWLVDHFPHEHCMSAIDGIGWPGTTQTGTCNVVYGGASSPILPEKQRFSLWDVGALVGCIWVRRRSYH